MCEQEDRHTKSLGGRGPTSRRQRRSQDGEGSGPPSRTGRNPGPLTFEDLLLHLGGVLEREVRLAVAEPPPPRALVPLPLQLQHQRAPGHDS